MQNTPQPAHTPSTESASEPEAKSASVTSVIQLNHTAVYAADRRRSAEFLADVLGLEVGAPFGPFLPVDLGNGVTLDYCEKRDEPIQSQHYAFLVPEERFDGMIDRLEALGVTYYADPHHTEPGRVNGWFGGRGAYFEDPSGHNMEIMTRPYVRP
ncbi:VOC family protein [Streptomyces mobaraensis NBRC 13819 = DSM 40847]|uniref:VOC family protein n=2 Tax=Streptomyces mobaraensis TaxID=35621 RepID=A0A5N5W8X2_STRMB|nr:VOC family protein [Streptomyces mobaraensis]EMF00889.1 putative cysteine transferase [Streptomyces mobaraensis NBRC 13819 = DSM 40847]KAB7846379.1 VOC family protein [Streptomyces mobaraensis]QTT76504.1 VOC family protein [Streptomyces mobaraensis NBRC 13819 = DSM 40847]